MEDLLYKYLNNELSQEEWVELRHWLDKSDLNKTTLNNLKSFTSNISHEAGELEQLVWKELKLANQAKKQVYPKTSRTLWPFLKVAAVFLILSALTVLAYRLYHQKVEPQQVLISTIIKEAPMGSKIKTRLPDGTTVTLNAGSKLYYPESFTNEHRIVQLEGEAFFDVTHNPEKPFFVEFNDSEVKVLGTSFNIRAYQEEQTSAVSVATGKVSFKSQDDELILLPMQMGVQNHQTSEMTKKKVDQLEAFGWTEKILYFNHTTFDKVIKDLERWYGVNFEINGDFTPLGTFSGEFRNESLNQVLQGLAHIYHFDFKIEKDHVTLDKK